MMEQLWLDYQRPPPGRQRPGLILFALGVLLSSGLVWRYAEAVAELEETSFQVSRLQREAARPAGAEDGPRAFGALAQRWEKLFAVLEAAHSDAVTVLSLQPELSARSAEIRIAGEAENFGSAMDYVKRLQAAGHFEAVYLTQAEVVRENPQNPVRFALLAQGRTAP